MSSTLNLTAPVVSALLPSCTSVFPPSSPQAGQSVFGNLVFTAGGQSTTVACSNLPLARQNSLSFPCYLPYLNSSSATDGYCERICPGLVSIQINAVALVQIVLNWIAWPLALLAIGLRLSVPKFCRYPSSLVILMLFGWFWSCFTCAISMVPDWRATACTPDKVPANAAYPWCAFQGFGRMFGVLVFLFAWVTLSVLSAVTVIVQRPFHGKISMLITYAVCILVPLILALVPVASNQVAPLTTNPTCFPTANYAYGIYYAWLGLGIVIGGVAVVIVMLRMGLSAADSSWKLRSNLRLLAFLVIGLFYVLWAFGYRFYAGFVPLTDAYNFWLACAIYAPNCPRGGSDGPGPGVLLNDGSLMSFTVFIWITPILITLLFLLQKELWTNWSSRIPPWVGLAKLHLTEGDEATETTAGSSSSSSGSEDTNTFMSDLS
jgi:hypothetical protein